MVHQNHGIGRYAGIQRMAVQGVTKDYLRIEYDKKDVLYVPVTQLDLLSRYTAPGDSENVKLSRLGGAEWTKTRKKVRAATEQMAKELIELYARRKRAHGHAFPPDDTWQGDFEQRFAYDERRTSFPARRRSNMIWSSPGRWTACCAAMSAWARLRLPCAPRSNA